MLSSGQLVKLLPMQPTEQDNGRGGLRCSPVSEARGGASGSALSSGSSSGTEGRLCCARGSRAAMGMSGTSPVSASRPGVRLAEMECALYHVRSHRLCPSGSCAQDSRSKASAWSGYAQTPQF